MPAEGFNQNGQFGSHGGPRMEKLPQAAQGGFGGQHGQQQMGPMGQFDQRTPHQPSFMPNFRGNSDNGGPGSEGNDARQFNPWQNQQPCGGNVNFNNEGANSPESRWANPHQGPRDENNSPERYHGQGHQDSNQPSDDEDSDNQDSTPSTFEAAVEKSVHDLVNAERAKQGLAALSVNDDLEDLARSHSSDMLQKNYFDHSDKNGCDPSCRAQHANFQYRAIGENIYMMSGPTLSAQDAAKRIVDGWMNSPGHRANILNKTFTTEGIGVSSNGGTVYATEDFAQTR